MNQHSMPVVTLAIKSMISSSSHFLAPAPLAAIELAAAVAAAVAIEAKSIFPEKI
jgi:hypothetical protein